MNQIATIICTVGAFLLLLFIGYLRMKGNVKEWLLWAVTQAEQYLGSGTGALKLRYVYDLAVEAFPPIRYLVPFSVFSLWVDEALDQMREQIKNNPYIKSFVKNKEEGILWH